MTSALDPIEAAARAALDGSLIVLPTDTVYGIGARPDDPAATALLFEAK
ncbi:MAG TPA: Sua5/YciO/YrdC/YwlC family protein [Actinomycetota bacterium]|nr:Sua5/YciO/YrdC/YwlC family protein [Actinomycetota bacterium]